MRNEMSINWSKYKKYFQKVGYEYHLKRELGNYKYLPLNKFEDIYNFEQDFHRAYNNRLKKSDVHNEILEIEKQFPLFKIYLLCTRHLRLPHEYDIYIAKAGDMVMLVDRYGKPKDVDCLITTKLGLKFVNVTVTKKEDMEEELLKQMDGHVYKFKFPIELLVGESFDYNIDFLNSGSLSDAAFLSSDLGLHTVHSVLFNKWAFEFLPYGTFWPYSD